jgi:hypothetical protein
MCVSAPKILNTIKQNSIIRHLVLMFSLRWYLTVAPGIKNTNKTTPVILKSRKYRQIVEPKLKKAGRKNREKREPSPFDHESGMYVTL